MRIYRVRSSPFESLFASGSRRAYRRLLCDHRSGAYRSVGALCPEPSICIPDCYQRTLVSNEFTTRGSIKPLLFLLTRTRILLTHFRAISRSFLFLFVSRVFSSNARKIFESCINREFCIGYRIISDEQSRGVFTVFFIGFC